MALHWLAPPSLGSPKRQGKASPLRDDRVARQKPCFALAPSATSAPGMLLLRVMGHACKCRFFIKVK
ncbi:MAG: hypothetical protein AVDCRST_MAG44-1390 [uncultured Sphingomonas sp.]|uniref:Uncharacterized protein n=1 Tax=uncultured Sphingomonas sp. TaxID=158754 RepID=A0A6J4T151_9SPHN|nr:MAG: hypothetical protein AVDCRST_MAG44-1390 [uncultured Sphingomonas sp.]